MDEKLHGVVMALARHNRKSFGQMAGVLMWRGLEAEAGTDETRGKATVSMDPETGFPLLCSEMPITEETVRSLEDEA